MLKKLLTSAVLLTCCAAVLADEVFRCEKDGKVTFTDRPCSKEAQPHAMTDPVVIVPPTRAERDLARQHDARLQRETKGRGKADAEWVKSHEAKKDYQEQVREAIMERRAIKGMSADEVRRALGEPDAVSESASHGSSKETWTYTADGKTRKVNFKNGEVSSVSTGRKKKK